MWLIAHEKPHDFYFLNKHVDWLEITQGDGVYLMLFDLQPFHASLFIKKQWAITVWYYDTRSDLGPPHK